MQILACLMPYNIREYKKIPLAVSKEERISNTDHYQSPEKCKGAFYFREKSHNRLCYGACALTMVFPTPFSDGGVVAQEPQFCWAIPILHINGSH